ncbi:MAG: virulence factor Mce family protein, partial [Aeromicrobium sp.]|nr:virulence factor Mce family protein [Aeromicrobium sp.]
MNSTLKTRLAGLLGLVLVVGAIGVALGAYQQVFTKTVDVTLTSDRAGLLLDKGAKVKAFGLNVGEVKSVDLQPDNTVRVTVALEPDSAKNIPRDVKANVGASTVFGAKFVELEVPDGTTGDPIRNDDVIAADRVTSEANDLFRDLDEVLTAVKPEEL